MLSQGNSATPQLIAAVLFGLKFADKVIYSWPANLISQPTLPCNCKTLQKSSEIMLTFANCIDGVFVQPERNRSGAGREVTWAERRLQKWALTWSGKIARSSALLVSGDYWLTWLTDFSNWWKLVLIGIRQTSFYYSYISELKIAECRYRLQRTTGFSGHERQIHPAHRSMTSQAPTPQSALCSARFFQLSLTSPLRSSFFLGGGTKEEKTWKRDRSRAKNGTYHETGWQQVQGWSLRAEGSWAMNQTDK